MKNGIDTFKSLSVEKIEKDIDKQYKEVMKEILWFSEEEILIISQTQGKNFAEKIKNFYEKNKNSQDAIKKALAKKIEEKIWEKGLEKWIKNFERLVLLIKELKNTKSIEDIVKIVQTDDFDFFLKLIWLDKKDFLEGKYVPTPVLSDDTNKLLEEVSKIWKVKSEVDSLKKEINDKEAILNVLGIDQNQLKNKLDLQKLSLEEISYVIKFQEALNNIPSKIANVLEKNYKELSQKDMLLLSDYVGDIFNLVKNAALLWIIDKFQIKKIQKILTEAVAFQQANLVVNNAKCISSYRNHNTSVLHRQKKASVNVDDVRYLEYMETPEKYDNFLNWEIGTKVLFYHLIEKDIPFNALKQFFVDFKKTKWYKILPQDMQTKFNIIFNLVNQSTSYEDYEKKVEQFKKNQKRAENLLILLDVYSKWMLWKWIDPGTYKKLTAYIFSGDWEKFGEEYRKAYSKIKLMAEGTAEWNGWEIDNALEKAGIPMKKVWFEWITNWMNSSLLIGWKVPDLQKIFSSSKCKLDNDTEVSSIIKKNLIPGMFDEETDAVVKENLIKNNVDSLIVKLYMNQLKTPEVIVKSGEIIYKFKEKQLIFKDNWQIEFKSNILGQKLDALNVKFEESKDNLKFGSLEIDIKNGLPEWFEDRVKQVNPLVKIWSDYLLKIKDQFRKLYVLINFIMLNKIWVDYSLITTFNQLGYILFGDNFSVSKLIKLNNPKIEEAYEDLENLKLETLVREYTSDKEREKKVDEMLDQQWRKMPLWQRQALCNAFDAKGDCKSKSLPGPVRNGLKIKVITQALIAQKSKFDYLYLNSSASSFLEKDIVKLQVSWWDKFFAITETIIKEIIPIVIATIVANVLVPETLFLTPEIVETFGMAKFMKYTWDAGRFLLRYGMVEPTVYTLSSNLIHWQGISFDGWWKNTLFYLLAPGFWKGFELIGAKLTGKLATNSSKFSKYLWSTAWWLGAIELTNLAINGQIDIGQIPYDLLFVALLHGTHKVIDPAMEKVWLNGLVWNKLVNKVFWKEILPEKSLWFKLPHFGSGKLKGAITKVWEKNIVNPQEVMKNLSGAQLVFKSWKTLDGTLWKKWNTTYRVEKDISGKFIVKEVSELKGIDVESIVYSNWKDVFIVVDKWWNLVIKSPVGNKVISDFIVNGKISKITVKELEKEIEKLKNAWVDIKLPGDKGFIEFEKVLKKISNNEKILEFLEKDINKLSEAEIKSLPIFVETKAKLRNLFKKKWLSEKEAEKKAEKVAVGVVKGVLKGSVNLLWKLAKLPFTIAGGLLKYGFYATVIWGWALAYDYLNDGKLDIVEWFKKEWLKVWLSAWGAYLGSFWKKHPTIWKTLWAVVWWIVWDKIPEFLNKHPEIVENVKEVEEKVKNYVSNLID